MSDDGHNPQESLAEARELADGILRECASLEAWTRRLVLGGSKIAMPRVEMRINATLNLVKGAREGAERVIRMVDAAAGLQPSQHRERTENALEAQRTASHARWLLRVATEAYNRAADLLDEELLSPSDAGLHSIADEDSLDRKTLSGEWDPLDES